jgi:hypothetical protein
VNSAGSGATLAGEIVASGAGVVRVTGFSWSLDTEAPVALVSPADHELVQLAGTISTTGGSLTLPGAWLWESGGFQGSGAVTADGDVRLAGVATRTLTGTTFTNRGSLVVEAGGIGNDFGSPARSIVNEGTWEIAANTTISSGGSFLNTGELTKTSGDVVADQPIVHQRG